MRRDKLLGLLLVGMALVVFVLFVSKLMMKVKIITLAFARNKRTLTWILLRRPVALMIPATVMLFLAFLMIALMTFLMVLRIIRARYRRKNTLLLLPRPRYCRIVFSKMIVTVTMSGDVDRWLSLCNIERLLIRRLVTMVRWRRGRSRPLSHSLRRMSLKYATRLMVRTLMTLVMWSL